jgi:ribose/xylose/arabinose/galactoside ABC-type transport system permease subunit
MKLRAQHLPVLTTAAVLVGLFATFSLLFPNFLSWRVIVNLFTNNAHVGVIAIGLTFVILAGGIDLSVGAVMACSAVFAAYLLQVHHLSPPVALGLALLVGTLFGAGMGTLIHFGQLPPFLVTLAGMFLARGLAFWISARSIEIRHPFYDAVVNFGLPVSESASLRVTSLIFITVFFAGVAVAHWTRFGRTVYAIGGSESSAQLMGMPVGATKVAIYALSGGCAALGGIVLTFQTQSADPTTGLGLELEAIAAVVIGGTLLSGGVGYVAGTLLGVLISGTILVGLDFHGGFDSSWQRIAIGALLLAFIGLQRFLTRLSVWVGSR